MTKDEISIGLRVRSLIELANVPRQTEGVIIEDYHTGILVGWCIDWEPVLPIEEYRIDRMAAIDPRCPSRDGFAYNELDLLEVIK